MSEHLGGTPTYEYKNPERSNIAERLATVVEILGYEEDATAAEARAALMERVGADGRYDRDNQEHRDLLIAYQDAGVAALGERPDYAAVIGFDLAQAQTWLQMGDTERFLAKLDSDDEADPGVVEMMFDNYLDAAVIEVLAIMDDFRALNRPA